MQPMTKARYQSRRRNGPVALLLLLAGVTCAVPAASQPSRPPSVTIPAARTCAEVDRLAAQHGLPRTNQLVVRRRAALRCDTSPPPPPPPPPPISREEATPIQRVAPVRARLNAARSCGALQQIAGSVGYATTHPDVRRNRARLGCDPAVQAPVDTGPTYEQALTSARSCAELRRAAVRFNRTLTGPLGRSRRSALGCDTPPPPPPPPPSPPVVAARTPVPPPPVQPVESSDGLASRGWAAWQAGRLGEGRTLLVTACEGGSASGCNSLGVTWDSETGNRDFPRQPHQALAYFRIACDDGLTLACNNARLVTSRALDDRYDAAEARAFFLKSGYRNDQIDCAGGNAQQCLALAEGAGSDAMPDSVTIHYWTDRACSGGLTEACHELADMIFTGSGIAANPTDALARWTALCDTQNYAPSCDWAAYAAFNLRRPVDEVRLRAARACQAGVRDTGCWVTGLMYQSGYGQPLALNEAEQEFARSCQAFDPIGCRLQAEIHEGTAFRYANPATAVVQRGRACRLGDSLSCARLNPDQVQRAQGS